MSTAIVPEIEVRLSPRVRRVTQNNPGLMTGPGTNTYIVGAEAFFVIDPGQDTDDHFDALVKAIGRAEVVGIAPTHAHPDHWPMAPRLAAALQAPTYGFAARNGFEPVVTVAEGARIRIGGLDLEALHTPGHAQDHISYFLPQERALFTGDHVMGWSTSVIAAPDGTLNDYLASLERLKGLDLDLIYPAHGDPVPEPRRRIEELIAHRHERTRQIIEALKDGATTVDEIVSRVYAGIDPRLHPAARQSVQAHLDSMQKP